MISFIFLFSSHEYNLAIKKWIGRMKEKQRKGERRGGETAPNIAFRGTTREWKRGKERRKEKKEEKEEKSYLCFTLDFLSTACKTTLFLTLIFCLFFVATKKKGEKKKEQERTYLFKMHTSVQAERCPYCQKRVYHAERVFADGKVL